MSSYAKHKAAIPSQTSHSQLPRSGRTSRANPRKKPSGIALMLDGPKKDDDRGVQNQTQNTDTDSGIDDNVPF